MSRILDIQSSEYRGVWRLWKVTSLGLFAIFIWLLADIAVTLRRLETGKRLEFRVKYGRLALAQQAIDKMRDDLDSYGKQPS